MKNDKNEIVSDMCNQLYQLTAHALEHLENENIPELVNTLDNRERVINVLNQITQSGNNSINAKTQNLIIEITSEVDKIDKFIDEKLHSLRDKVHLEIAKVFKTKENFKGYNLNDLK